MLLSSMLIVEDGVMDLVYISVVWVGCLIDVG